MVDATPQEPAPPSLCDSLLGDCRESWQALHDHPFIRELAAGTLAPDRFRFYVEQDLFFLPELARAVAIGITHAGDTEAMRHFAEETAIVVGRELENQHELLRRIAELGAVERGGSLCAAPATLAYGSYLVATAHRGGSLDVMAALLPCTWSYADIAVALEDEIASHPVYGEWVRFFANPEYVELIAGRRQTLDRLAQGIGVGRRRRLSEIFTTSTRLERRFWDMAYRLEQWPDLAEAA
jgi:thiaminase/transcriptional activator TenA